MKIAVFHNLPSGGGKRALYGFVKYLVKSGHIVDAFVPSTVNEAFLSLRNFSNEFNIFPVRNTFTGLMLSTFQYLPPVQVSLADLKRTERNIANVINHGDYDVVFSEQDQFTFSPFFLKFVKKPTCYYCQQPGRANEVILHNVSLKIKNKTPIEFLKRRIKKYFDAKLNKIDKYNASFAKYILSNSYFSKENILRNYGLNSSVCYLGIDTEIFKPIKASKENYVLSVGSCLPSKGFDFIVRALSLIDAKIRPKLIIVSNSVYVPWKKYLERIASQTQVSLEIKSLVTDEALVRYYNKAKLFLYAPYLEPFGLAPLEAMACGTPVIAVKEGGVRETVVHNEVGILTERDETMFANAIVSLLLNKGKSLNMGQKGSDMVLDFWTLKHAGERLLWHLDRGAKLLK